VEETSLPRVFTGLIVRAGYSHGKQPIPTNETQFNVLAPGVIEDHVTLGATWTLTIIRGQSP